MFHHSLPLRYQWGMFLLMLPLIHFAPHLALIPLAPDPSLTPLCNTQRVACTLLSLLLHPFTHANLLHWAVNLFTWLFLWRYVSLLRLLMAYASTLLAGYLYIHIGSLPLCGFSGIICWFLGLLVPVRGIPYLFRLSPLLIIPFFLPHIAASVHLTCFLLGWFYSLLIHQK